MANLFANIPVPAGNGSGAPVDVSTFGYYKTVSVAGPFVGSVTVEVSNELVPTKWAPVAVFGNADGANLGVAARWMRASVAGYVSGAPTCDLGGTDEGASFATLPATAGDGAGAAVDVSSLPSLKTVTVGGPYRGYVQVEVSEDGLTRWSQVGFGFSNPGLESQQIIARYMRVVRSGVPQTDPGLPLVNVGACAIATGVGGSTIIVEDEGVPVAGGPFTALDFVGGGVVAANAGAGLATITIPGTVTTDGITITGDGSTGNPLVVTPASVTGLGSQFLGDGSDGALTYDGVATVLGVVPATEPATSPYAGARAYFLDRDIFGTKIAIAANTVVVGNGQRVWCTGDIAGPGKIARSGSPGATATTNAGGAGGNGTSTDFLGGSGAGGNGGNGGNPNSIGNGGGFGGTAPYRFTAGGTAITPISGVTGAPGAIGQGGSGGSTEAAGLGGPGGVNVIVNTTNGGYVATHPQYLTGRTLSNAPFTGGTGGGGGAGGYATSGPTANAGGGGGGGGGAGPLVVAARSFSGGVTIEAVGGNGGVGADAVAGGVANGGAGGAGGAGSWVAVCYAEGAVPTVAVTGGVGGAGGASTGGALQAGAGGNGGAGFALVFNLGG